MAVSAQILDEVLTVIRFYFKHPDISKKSKKAQHRLVYKWYPELSRSDIDYIMSVYYKETEMK